MCRQIDLKLYIFAMFIKDQKKKEQMANPDYILLLKRLHSAHQHFPQTLHLEK